MTSLEILNFVFESGRIETDSDEDREGYFAEVKAEIEFEALERIQSGEYDGTTEEAVEFALAHIN